MHSNGYVTIIIIFSCFCIDCSGSSSRMKRKRRIFKKKVSDHIRYVINKAKRTKEKPDFITADDWIEITRTWETEKHKKICEQNRKNRASSSSDGSASATYAGGSISISEYRRRMLSLFKLVSSFNSMVTNFC